MGGKGKDSESIHGSHVTNIMWEGRTGFGRYIIDVNVNVKKTPT